MTEKISSSKAAKSPLHNDKAVTIRFKSKVDLLLVSAAVLCVNVRMHIFGLARLPAL